MNQKRKVFMYIRGTYRGKEMGYALFAQKKLVLDGQLNMLQTQQAQRTDEQFVLATRTTSLQQQLTSINAAQSGELAELYGLLSSSTTSQSRDSINAEIKEMELAFEKEVDEINRKIYQVSIKENAIEMEVKRLDTMVTAIEKQLEAVEEAEGGGIDRATPKFNGVG